VQSDEVFCSIKTVHLFWRLVLSYDCVTHHYKTKTRSTSIYECEKDMTVYCICATFGRKNWKNDKEVVTRFGMPRNTGRQWFLLVASTCGEPKNVLECELQVKNL